MNERIKQLAEEAIEIVAKKRILPDGQVERTWRPEYYDQVFAELVVRECARIGELKEQGYSEYDPDISVGWYMRQHFGVEE